jgi:hypothetical protein
MQAIHLRSITKLGDSLPPKGGVKLTQPDVELTLCFGQLTASCLAFKTSGGVNSSSFRKNLDNCLHLVDYVLALTTSHAVMSMLGEAHFAVDCAPSA